MKCEIHLIVRQCLRISVLLHNYCQKKQGKRLTSNSKSKKLVFRKDNIVLFLCDFSFITFTGTNFFQLIQADEREGTKRNFRNTLVSSGEAAVEYSKNHCTDLLMLDMIVLLGQNGRKTFEQILKWVQMYLSQSLIRFYSLL